MSLSLWPERAQAQLQALLRSAEEHPRPYAVFDCDGTLWEHDLTEALLPMMERDGVISLRGLDRSILVLEPRPGEDAFGYYDRVCKLDIRLGYYFIAASFQGVPLRSIRAHVEALFQEATVQCGARLIPAPAPYAAMRQLIGTLEAAGVEVWVMTAATEEVVRLGVVSRLGVAPERVVGASFLLSGSEPTVSAWERAAGLAGDAWFSPERMERSLSCHPMTPLPWFEGKVAAIRAHIEPHHRPLLVAGDSPNDLPMQSIVDVTRGGLRIRVRSDDRYDEATEAAIERAGAEGAQGWLTVSPGELHGGREPDPTLSR
jgi:phosphorylcholine phosphatase